MAIGEIGRRIWAARVYAGYDSRKRFAEAIETSEPTLQRIEQGERAVKRSELLVIAETCKVPMWFLEEGWNGYLHSIDAEGRAALRELDRSERRAG